MLDDRARISSLICVTNSRVGARIRAWIPGLVRSIFCKREITNAAVLPVPV